MERLEDVPVDRLRRALDEVEGATPAKRLLAAIAYKNGVPQTELAEWFGVDRRTIHNWLARLEEGPLERAARDDTREGRPRKLDERQRARLEAALHEPPTEVGYDAPSWTPALVGRYLEEAFGVTYSRPSCRRLMKEAGLCYRKSAPAGEDRGGRWVPE